jgi:hypothetical protein
MGARPQAKQRSKRSASRPGDACHLSPWPKFAVASLLSFWHYFNIHLTYPPQPVSLFASPILNADNVQLSCRYYKDFINILYNSVCALLSCHWGSIELLQGMSCKLLKCCPVSVCHIVLISMTLYASIAERLSALALLMTKWGLRLWVQFPAWILFFIVSICNQTSLE